MLEPPPPRRDAVAGGHVKGLAGLTTGGKRGRQAVHLGAIRAILKSVTEAAHRPSKPEPRAARVSDAERQRVIDILRDETAAGRLSLDEFEERAAEAWATTTTSELEHVLRELPNPADNIDALPTTPGEPRDLDTKAKRRYWAQVRNSAAGWVGANAFFGAIWLSNGADGKFWPFWILLPTSIGLVTTLIRGPDRERAEREWREQQRLGRADSDPR